MCVHVCVCVSVYEHMSTVSATCRAYTCVYVYACKSVCMYVCMCVNVCICVCM